MAREDKIYVVTGAGRGLGLELSRQLLARGYHVIAGVRHPAAAVDLLALESESLGRLRVLALDVQSEESTKDFVRVLGADRVDVLINNAGIYVDSDDRIESTPVSTLIETFNTNAAGVFRVTQSLLPLLRKSQAPKVINITSQMGSVADNKGGGSPAYRMSKAALNMFTKTLSIEEPELIALALHPGWVKTKMGGPGAPLPATASAEGLLGIIEAAKRTDSGTFKNYTGQPLPW